MGNNVTREMVAKLANVSKQTVSYYLNNTRSISEKTAKKIDLAIKELGYIPNEIARSLSSKSSKTVAVICNDISNPNYSDVISGIEHEASKNGYTILIYNAKSFSTKTASNIVARKVDGVISLTFKRVLGTEAIDLFEKKGITYVLTHSGGIRDERFMQLEPDFSIGINEALVKLKGYGNSNVTMLSAFPISEKVDNRLEQFLDGHKKVFNAEGKYISFDTVLPTSLETGELLAKKFIAENNDSKAVIATNDLVAIGALKVFMKNNKKISVIGIDNTVFCDYITPSLSSIGYNKELYGKRLFQMFFERFHGEKPRFESFPTYLYERNSVKLED